MQPLGAVALGACRSWSTLVSGGWWGYEQVVRHDWAQIIEAGRQTLRFDSRPWLATTTVPTAVIATDNDDLVPHARQLALAAAIPGATLRVIGGGHTACTEAPGLFVPALLEACLEVTARAAAAPSAVVAALAGARRATCSRAEPDSKAPRIGQVGERRCGAAAASSEVSRAACLRDEP